MDKKSKKKVVAPTPVAEKSVVVTAPVAPVKSEADKIWDEIKNLKLEMFALDNQFVHLYYKPVLLDPSKLHLTALTKATSALPALETAVSPKYQTEQVDRFITVTLSPPKVKK